MGPRRPEGASGNRGKIDNIYYDDYDDDDDDISRLTVLANIFRFNFKSFYLPTRSIIPKALRRSGDVV